jgi:hypothetical protein
MLQRLPSALKFLRNSAYMHKALEKDRAATYAGKKFD